MNWHEGLDEESPAYTVAASGSPRVRVVAGPGSGKSFAMKRRVARLLEEGIDPRSILPVTFTRVAAEDLHRELVGMGVEGCSRLQGTTLHSLALRTLMRKHVLEATGRTPRPLNEFESKPLEVDLGSYGGLREVRRMIRAYEAAWARLQHEVPGYAQSQREISFAHDLVQWLMFHRAMLIGEVIPQFYEYISSNPAAEERSEYSHILVDEYQDLNKAEQATLDLLSDQAHVCIVGDDDQSIYSFKHAHPEGIREWAEIHADADDLSLAECRRCPTRVAKMANSLISHNQLRPVPRELVPREENGDGDIRIVQFKSLSDEIEGVVDAVEELVDTGNRPGDILILAQRGAIGTPVYELLIERGIRVTSYYAESELNSEEAQRKLSLLKLLVDRDDRVALRWLLGLGSKNWRSPSYLRIRAYCNAEGISPWEALTRLSDGALKIPHTKPLVARFNEIREQLYVLERCADIATLVDELFPAADEAMRDIRDTALRVLAELDSSDRRNFLSELIGAITTPEVPSEVEEVRIMSLHKSKGLSSPITIIAGCVEGLLPMRPDPSLSPEARSAYMEEQRRLFYVGVSRVKATPSQGQPGTLILTYSQRMPLATAMSAGIAPATSGYGTATLHASRFIAELGSSAPSPVAG